MIIHTVSSSNPETMTTITDTKDLEKQFDDHRWYLCVRPNNQPNTWTCKETTAHQALDPFVRYDGALTMAIPIHRSNPRFFDRFQIRLALTPAIHMEE